MAVGGLIGPLRLRVTKDTKVPRCGVLATIELLGGRYKLLILRALLYAQGPLRFGALRGELQGVSQKTLTRNLRDLGASGLLTRTQYAEIPPRVEYELTDSGASLMPVFAAMDGWAGNNLDLDAPSDESSKAAV